MSNRSRLLFGALALAFAGSVGAWTAPRPAAADDVTVDVSIFYSSLEPYGSWVQLEPYGWAFVPDNVDFAWRPYTLGQWQWIDPYGWTWVSDEPFGWATYHYGRWTYVDDYGWAWLPGTRWAPAWVAFRYGDPWVGWAPLPPGPNWRIDAAFEVGGVDVGLSIGSFAWSFVPVRWFAEPNLRSRVYVSAYTPWFVQRTQGSTRYEPVDGGYANLSVGLDVVERSRGAPVPRRRLRDATTPARGPGARVEGDEVVLFRPRVAVKPPARGPAPRVRVEDPAGADLEAWAAQRRAALKAHLDAERKALDEADGVPVRPLPANTPDDAERRRQAALKALEEEKARLEAALERQRQRRERERRPPSKPANPPGMDDGHGKHGKDDDHGMK